MPPLVSVIIPTYYRNERLKKAIESAQNQTHTQLEIIVVDGTGEDHANSVASEYACEYIVQEEDQGPHAARSDGAGVSNGSYIQFLDDDDELHPTKIEKQVDLLESNPEVGVAYCGIRHESGHEELPSEEVRGNILHDALSFKPSTYQTSTILIDSDVLEQIMPVSNRHGADDIGMRIELAQITKFDYINEALVTMGEPDYSLGTSWESIEGRWELLGRYSDLYQQVPDECRQYALAELYQRAGRRHIEEHIWSLSAIYCFAQVLRHRPEIKPLHLAEFMSSIGGRYGRKIAQRARS